MFLLYAPGGSSGKESQLTGIYDLVAVLTHKGRSADSGHYVAWVKQESGKFSNEFVQCFVTMLFGSTWVFQLMNSQCLSQGNGLSLMMTILFHNGRKI